MRGAGIGLIGLLLCGAIIFYLTWGGPGNPGQVRPALEAKQQAETVVNMAQGRDDKGVPVTDSITYEVTPKGILVKTVTAGGPMEKKLGLKAGDLIVEVGPLSADQFASSDGAAREFMQTQYARPDSWMVVRNGQKIHLPDQRSTPAAGEPAVAVPPPTPPAPAVENKPSNGARTNPKGQALDVLRKKEIESH